MPRHAHDEESQPLLPSIDDLSPAAREVATRKKLRTYESYLALHAGYVPSTKQIIGHLQYYLRSPILDPRSKSLSDPGKKLVRDVRACMEEFIEWLLEKNRDDKFQDLLWHAKHAHASLDLPNFSKIASHIAAQTTPQTNAQKAWARMRFLISVLYTSPQFRKLLGDATMVAKDVFADAADVASEAARDAAKAARPSKDELKHVDEVGKAPSGAEVRQNLASTADSVVDSTKASLLDAPEDIAGYVQSKFPKSRQDALLDRLKNVVVDVEKNPDYSEAVDYLLEFVETYVERLSSTVEDEAIQVTDSVHTDQHFDLALRSAKGIIGVMADGRSPDVLLTYLSNFLKSIRNDSDLRAFLGKLYGHLRDPNKMTSHVDQISRYTGAIFGSGKDKANAGDREIFDLWNEGRDLLDTKPVQYKDQFGAIVAEIEEWFKSLSHDRTTSRVFLTGEKVFEDLLGSGKAVNMTLVYRDLIEATIFKAIEMVKYIPIPRIEFKNQSIDLIVENLTFESHNFVPRRVLLEALQKAEYTNIYRYNSDYTALTRVRIENVGAFFKDASFMIRKTTGFFRFSDQGFLDVNFDGTGASAEIILKTTTARDGQSQPYFEVESIKVAIHSFKYRYHAYHSWLAFFARPFVYRFVKNIVTRVIESVLTESINGVNEEIAQLRLRMANAIKSEDANTATYVKAFLTKGVAGRKPYQGPLPFALNVGISEELFPGEYTPGSIVALKAYAEEEVDHQGRTWRSDVFDVGV